MLDLIASISLEGDQPIARSYQNSLRAIGAILDGDIAGRISIVEVDDGFLVRRQRFRHTHVDMAMSHLTWEQLDEELIRLARDRPHSARVRRPGLWGSFPHSHQDFFRALGYELDQVDARQVVVDELSHALLLSYDQPVDGSRPETREVTLTPDDIEQVLNDAILRRRSGPETRGAPLSTTAFRHVDRVRTLQWATLSHDLPYQQRLRALGAALDQQDIVVTSLMETPNGFVARCRGRDGGEEIVEHFDVAQLEEMTARNRDSRKRLLAKSMPRGYQDLFRALGYELERQGAFSIMLHEHGGSFTVSYEYLDPRRSFTALKQILSLSPTEQDTLTRQARSRRHQSSKLTARLAHRVRSPRPEKSSLRSIDVLRPGG